MPAVGVLWWGKRRRECWVFLLRWSSLLRHTINPPRGAFSSTNSSFVSAAKSRKWLLWWSTVPNFQSFLFPLLLFLPRKKNTTRHSKLESLLAEQFLNFKWILFGKTKDPARASVYLVILIFCFLHSLVFPPQKKPWPQILRCLSLWIKTSLLLCFCVRRCCRLALIAWHTCQLGAGFAKYTVLCQFKKLPR